MAIRQHDTLAPWRPAWLPCTMAPCWHPGTMTTWHHDTMAVFLLPMALWCHGIMHGRIASGHPGTMAPWHHGIVPLCHWGSIAAWQHGSMAAWHCGTVALWHPGILVLWHHGTRALWHQGIPAPWLDHGMVVNWNVTINNTSSNVFSNSSSATTMNYLNLF